MTLARRVVLVTSTMMGMLLYTIDATIANVALPHMQSGLQASQDQVAWVLTSYIVVSAVMTPLTIVLAGRYGRGRLMMFCVAGFTLSSMLCGAATSLFEMVLFRMMQGAFGAGLSPLSQTVLLDNSPPEKHGQAMGIWTVGMMLGPIIGPTLGGFLTDQLNWRWVFYVNVPVGALALIGIAFTVPRDKPKEPRPFDLFGYLLLAVAIGSLQLCLDRGADRDWFNSLEIVLEASIAAIGMYMFVVHSLTTAHPFFVPTLFGDRNFLLGCVRSFALPFMLIGVSVLLPSFLQHLQGYPVAQSGWLMAPRGIGMIMTSLLAGRLMARFDPRGVMAVGLLIGAASLWVMRGFTADVPAYMVGGSMFLQGLGMGLTLVPSTVLMFGTLTPTLRMEGTTFMALIQAVGMSIGVSVTLAYLVNSTKQNQARLVESMGTFDVDKWRSVFDVAGDDSVGVVTDQIARQAAAIAYANDFSMILFVVLLMVPTVFFVRLPGRGASAKSAPPVVHAE
jgi:DHA2 family multidrug resistance protein